MRYRDLFEGKNIDDLIKSFKQEYSDSIKYGCRRDNCGIPAADLMVYGSKYGFDIKRVSGTFRADKALYKKKDFTQEELRDMKRQGLDINDINDRKKYAIQKNIVDELKLIPHYWNEYNGKIIDLTGEHQFIKTGLSSDLSPVRYTVN